MKPYTHGDPFIEGLIYLKVIKDKVEAFGDKQSLINAESAYKTGKLYDFSVTPKEWKQANSTARIVNGSVVLGLPQDFIVEQQEELIRNERYLRLRACDKISPMRWNAMTEAQKQAWTKYRQDLLNIPQLSGFPWNGDVDAVPWPVQPE